MREYESVFVLNPNLDDSQVDVEVEKIREFLISKDSEITEVQKWGRRKLAYEIAKNREGVYTLIRFSAGSDIPKELDRRYRLNENMLRFLTVQYEHPPVDETAPEGMKAAAPEGMKAAAPEGAAAAAPEGTAAAAPEGVEASLSGKSEGEVGSSEPEPDKDKTSDEESTA